LEDGKPFSVWESLPATRKNINIYLPPSKIKMSKRRSDEQQMQQQMEFEAKRLERSRMLNRLLQEADTKDQLCTDRIAEADRCLNSDDEEEEPFLLDFDVL
jgi:hypothetical protein